MHPSRALLATASVALCLVLGADGFVPSFNTFTHHSSSSIRAGGIPQTHVPHGLPTSTRLVRVRATATARDVHNRDSVLMMATGGSKKRRRKKNSNSSSGAGTTATEAATAPRSNIKGNRDKTKQDGGGGMGALGDVLEGDRSLEALFSDDWSGMQANAGMVKSKVELPDLATYVPKSRPEVERLEQRQKKSAVGLTIGKAPPEEEELSRLRNYKSKLSPIVDREKEASEKRAAERFQEGPVIRALKAATWFAICTLVVWEIYINSPWFPGAPQSPLSS